MKKKIISNFIKDRLGYAITFYLGIALVILYYYSISNITDIYPILIASIIFIIFLAIDFLKYYSFNIEIKDSINLEKNKLMELTKEQKYFVEVLKDMQDEYLKEISKTNSESNSYRYFISQWVHNMKTPISIISLVLQKMKFDVNSNTSDLILDSINNSIQEINEENDKLENGLEQLLNILRMEQFARDYEPESVDLLASIKELINSKKSLFIYNNVFPQIECNYDNIRVFTDEKWNKFMLDQIINNAVKYSTEKGVKKYIRFRIVSSNNQVILEIIDEGIGISKVDLNRVFEPFFTGENGRKYKGASGIGLYICKQLSKNLKHKLEIESEQYEGTKVIVTYFLND